MIQSVELDYQRIVSLLSGSHHSVHVFQQKAPSGLARV
jgi:hypothetical protein